MTLQNNHDTNDPEKLFLEQARAYYREMRAVASDASDGQVLRLAEAFAVQYGQELIRQSLETIVQDEVDTFEKKRRRCSAQNAKPKKEIADDEVNKS